jgi:hypothetical protein
LKEPPCDDAIWSPTTEQGLLNESVEMLEKHNIIGVTSGPAELVRAYKESAPERIVQGVLLGGPLVGESESIDSLRAALVPIEKVSVARLSAGEN